MKFFNLTILFLSICIQNSFGQTSTTTGDTDLSSKQERAEESTQRQEVESDFNTYEQNLDREVKEGNMTGASSDKFQKATSDKFAYYDLVKKENANEYVRSAKEANTKEAYLKSLVPNMNNGIKEMKAGIEAAKSNYDSMAALEKKMDEKLGGTAAGSGTFEGVGAGKNKFSTRGSLFKRNGKRLSADEIISISKSGGDFSKGILNSSNPNSKSALGNRFRKKSFSATSSEGKLKKRKAVPLMKKARMGSFEAAVKKASDLFSQRFGMDALSGLFNGSNPLDPNTAKRNLVMGNNENAEEEEEVKKEEAKKIAAVKKKKLGSSQISSGYEEDLEDDGYGKDANKDENLYEYEFADGTENQINQDEDVPLWSIITNRYIISAYPRLGDEVARAPASDGDADGDADGGIDQSNESFEAD